MDERDFFDKLAPTWDENEVLSTPERINYILDFIDIRPGQAVLDLGTGTGVLLPYLAERVGKDGRITAVDYSTGMLSRAERKYSGLVPKPEFLCIDFENENVPGKFDHIILYSVYPHLHTPADTIRWFMAMNLNEGGNITIAFPSGPDFINSIHRQKHSESDILPPAEVLASQLRDCDINAAVVPSDSNSYVITIKKD